jgi:hypothetical protein
MDSMALANIIIVGFTTVFSFGLLVISFISYRRSKNKKILFVNLVLLLFFIKNLLLSLNLFAMMIQDTSMIFVLELFDLLILVFLFVAVLTK